MSHIRFQTKQNEACVGGRERHFCSGLISNMAKGLGDFDGFLRFKYKPEEVHIAMRTLGIGHKMELDHYLMGMLNPERTIGDETFNKWWVELNTALVCGSDEMRFAVRVHASCETFGYVEDPNREWLAGIIERGLTVGILREESQGYGRGWRDVIDLLMGPDDGPVVMDTSVADSFPIVFAEGDHTEDDGCHRGGDGLAEGAELSCPICLHYRNFAELTHDEQWDRAVVWLREQDAQYECGFGLEMKPDNWAQYRYGDGRTVFDMKAAIYAEYDRRMQVFRAKRAGKIFAEEYARAKGWNHPLTPEQLAEMQAHPRFSEPDLVAVDSLLEARERFIRNYCREKGWSPKHLTPAQKREMEAHEDWPALPIRFEEESDAESV